MPRMNFFQLPVQPQISKTSNSASSIERRKSFFAPPSISYHSAHTIGDIQAQKHFC
jgi:hypothetical protein